MCILSDCIIGIIVDNIILIVGGKLIAFGGTGRFAYDYDVTNPGKTAIYSEMTQVALTRHGKSTDVIFMNDSSRRTDKNA